MRTAWLAALVLGGLCLWAQSDPAEQVCTVEGTVVDARTQAGIPGVRVTAMMTLEGRDNLRSSGMGAFTDSNGKFRLTKVKPGQYFLSAAKADFEPTRRRPVLLPALEAGRELKGVRVELQPLATLSGRVVNENGDPVSGATVELMARVSAFNRKSISSTGGAASTDDRGIFLIHRASPGHYLLSATHMESRNVIYPLRGGGVSGYVRTFLPGVSDPEQARWLEVTPGSEQNGLEIQLRREPVYRVRGLALDESGAPVPRFVVNVQSGLGIAPLQNRTFMNGQFEIEGLRPGQYSLMARSVTMGDSGQSARVALNLGQGDVDNLQIRLSPGMRLQCTAILEGAGERKPDWQRVEVVPMFLAPLGPAADQRVKPAADGSFVLEIAGSGSMWFKVTGQPAAGTYLAEIRSGPENLLDREVDASSGLQSPMRFVFRTGSARLSGQVEDANGRPASAGASVLAFDADAAKRSLGSAISASVKADGSFELAELPPSDYLVYATMEEELRPFGVTQAPEDLEQRATKVRLPAGGTQAVRLKLTEEKTK
ncbi:carboxypeptidase-like regulatory domain-containing protein [Paludibaculum fermentans]|uniref:Carboxypeptidase regulatory-like domain-containing protein n=1 Tax=Paludibaculum fermentans TaxID=1473598 RepID=A0A7S7NXD3_PALFE|nr:carboxypeptidase-like regulatory domain-containing protein [Paludibaculum fermentans]QOY91535.1 carboxypeptidase regulatory-like domain-containing protein [Paludibaculum fermentans]